VIIRRIMVRTSVLDTTSRWLLGITKHFQERYFLVMCHNQKVSGNWLALVRGRKMVKF
jgi:hypothetical protein